jgi:hypothetical protein
MSKAGGSEMGPVLGSPATTGTAFNTLASYLFGANSKSESMAMTTPVEIRRGGGEYSMSFGESLPWKRRDECPSWPCLYRRFIRLSIMTRTR